MKLTKWKSKNWHPQRFLVGLLWLATIAYGQAQEIAVSGTVIDDSGLPLAGANVVVKGTTTGTQTDFDGNYTISADGKATLVYSYIGYTTQEVAVNNEQKIDVTLAEDASKLDEVVVIGYGTQKKSDLTGAISSVSSEEINEIAVVTVGQALQGRAPGVTVTASTGQPGANSTIRIRGVGTVNNSDPYVIIDGVPGNLNNLNSADIKSIEVLKDASATAIYGSNGANGVILVTTKTGRPGKVTVNFDSYIGTQERARDLNMLDSQQWAGLVNEGYTNDGLEPKFSADEIANMDTYDWGNLIFRTGFIQNNQLSVSGGNEFASYFVSYGYTDQAGILKSSAFNRHNIRINNEYKLNDNITLGHRLSYSVRDQNTRSESGVWLWGQTAIQGYGWEPNIPFYTADGLYSSPTSVSAIHPDAEVRYRTNKNTNREFSLNAYLNINFLKNFSFRTTYAPQFTTSERYDFDPVIDPGNVGYGVTGGILRTQNQLESRADQSRSYTWSNVLTYNNDFGKHGITLMAGHEQQEFTGINTRAFATNLSDLFGDNVVVEDGNSTTGAGNRWESNLFSLFSRFIYNYDNRYLLTATVRRDGSSKFGPEKRYGTFPAAALSWNVHNEKFMENSFLDQFKVRAGIGEIGNRSIDDFAFFSELSVGPSAGVDVVFGDQRASGAASKGVANPLLQWESTTTTNVGVDLGFLNNRLTFSVDYFDRKTKDMILLIPPQTQSSGLTESTLFNKGTMSNTGWEFALGYSKQYEDFGFSLGANMDMIDNELTSLDTNNAFLAVGGAFGQNGFLRSEPGYEVSYFYGFETDGVFQNDADVAAAAEQGAVPGDLRFVDQLTVDTDGDGTPDQVDGVINADDRTKIGSPHADFNYSFNLDFNYKNWDLGIFLQGTQGNEIFSSLPYFFESELGSGLQESALGRWHGEGTSNTLPRVTLAGNARNIQISDRYVYDGSYLRVKNLQLGYNFSADLVDRIGLDKLRVYISGQNLHTFTKYDIGFDPEIGKAPNEFGENNSLVIGLDRGGYPQPRTFLFGINLTL
ncbi:TonB-dependent receptor [Zobellia amurskyensis]|uniref:TonB-dependent receptor n=1 Tax=Zobellia amurskyensis TaxID=248905 RepID=A0A7X2ZRT3_9FLAO|nr:TonB-dependent receptor [Zobellia amurskyensis]MUH35228.1 TonB-dependent receptor [Zobellia amurskyensis]